jgi:hypothetical protein
MFKVDAVKQTVTGLPITRADLYIGIAEYKKYCQASTISYCTHEDTFDTANRHFKIEVMFGTGFFDDQYLDCLEFFLFGLNWIAYDNVSLGMRLPSRGAKDLQALVALRLS